MLEPLRGYAIGSCHSLGSVGLMMVTWRSRSEITVTPLSLAHAMKAESVLNVWPLYCAWVMSIGLNVFSSFVGAAGVAGGYSPPRYLKSRWSLASHSIAFVCAR